MFSHAIRLGCQLYHEKCPAYDRVYARFLSRKKSSNWNNVDEFGEREINILIDFLDGFQAFSPFKIGKSTPAQFQELPGVLLSLERFSQNTILDIDLVDDEVRQIIRQAYRVLQKCGPDDNFYSVAASKMLHAINPRLFIMWDNDIKWFYDCHHAYVDDFMRRMQRLAKEAVSEVVQQERMSLAAAASFTNHCRQDSSLAKIIDEYNFTIAHSTFTLTSRLSRSLGLGSPEVRRRLKAI